MKESLRFVTVVAWALSPLAGAPALETATGPQSPGTPTMEVLGNDSYQRAFLVFRTPVAITVDGKLETPLDPTTGDTKPIPDFQSPLPPADWMKTEFNDANWERARAPVEIGPGGAVRGNQSQWARHTATPNSIICLRSKFIVENPAGVRNLRLRLEYVGGVVVYINGQELTRAHLPPGELAPDTLAEKYPDDLYCAPNDLFLHDIIKQAAGFERRYRLLNEVEIPAKHLRPGMNVLALKIHRAPINAAAIKAKRVPAPTDMNVTPGIWAYAGLRSLRLSAAPGSALVPNVARPKGLQVWGCAPVDTVTAFDYADGGNLPSVTVCSPRNGVFSGRLVVSSDQPIRGLAVAVSDLSAAKGGGRIPAAAIRVRCAAPAQAGKSWAPAHRFDGLFDVMPAEIPVIKATPPREYFPHNHGKYIPDGPILITRANQTGGALAPLWLTVRVPPDAKPGTYEGTIRVSADDLPPTRVPFQVSVTAWIIPDTKDFRIQNFAYLSEDALAKHYGVPLWSDKHFELMGRSMALMAEINSRQALANLTINFYGGNKGSIDCSNEQTLIRWIEKPDGSYQHDFSLFDKYLDLAARHMGKPRLLRLNCWGEFRPGWGGATSDPAALWQTIREGRMVTRLDPATGKLEPMAQPRPGTEESFQFWQPVLEQVRRKIEARNWFDVTAMGHNSYNAPPQASIVSVYRRIWPDGVWSFTAHNGVMGGQFPALEKGVSMPVRYADCVWTRGVPTARGYAALLKPRPTVWCYTFRTDLRDWSELQMPRDVPEEEIMCGHDGVSDFGADLFPIKSESGRYYCLGNGRGTGGPSDSTLAMLAPGPDGAIATERFEMLREGVEIGEAILFIQRAIEDKKIAGDLLQRANRLLDERGEAFLRRWSTGRFERDQRLLAFAGEVAAAGFN